MRGKHVWFDVQRYRRMVELEPRQQDIGDRRGQRRRQFALFRANLRKHVADELIRSGVALIGNLERSDCLVVSLAVEQLNRPASAGAVEKVRVRLEAQEAQKERVRSAVLPAHRNSVGQVVRPSIRGDADEGGLAGKAIEANRRCAPRNRSVVILRDSSALHREDAGAAQVYGGRSESRFVPVIHDEQPATVLNLRHDARRWGRALASP